MVSQPVIRAGNTDTTSNWEVTGLALNITTNKKEVICTVNCLGPNDFTLKTTIC